MKRRQLRAIPHASENAGMNLVIVIVAGLALYVAFITVLHEWLIGVRPFG